MTPQEALELLNDLEFSEKYQDKEEYTDMLLLCKNALEKYLQWAIDRTINGIYQLWDERRKQDLYHLLKEWYEKQSELSKQGLHSGGVTNLMSCIEKLDVYADEDVAQKLVKAVTNVYVENWFDNAYENFALELGQVKTITVD